MMTRLLTLLSIAILISTSCSEAPASKVPNTTTDTLTTTVQKEGTDAVASFNDLDIKPRFGGCKEVSDPKALKSCSDKRLAKFVSTNLQYPENARKLKIEGKAVVSFVIEVNGSISSIEATTNLGGGLEDEAIRVFHLMNEMKEWWVPGWKDGKRQRVKLQLPINFKL